MHGCDNAMLVQDGWSDIHNESVIATCCQMNDKSDLLKFCQMNDKSDLLKLITDQVLQPHVKPRGKRFNQAVLDEHLSAYKLLPLYRDTNLTRKQLGIVSEWILSHDSSFVTLVINYQAQVTISIQVFVDGSAVISLVNWCKAFKCY